MNQASTYLELLEKFYSNDTTFPIIWHLFLQTEKEKNYWKKKEKEKKGTVSSCHIIVIHVYRVSPHIKSLAEEASIVTIYKWQVQTE